MSFPIPEGEILLNGRLVPSVEARAAIVDPSVQSGVGVFETVAVRGGRAVDAPEHLARLGSGAAALSVPLPPPEALLDQVSEIASRVEGGFGWLKIVALRSGDVAVFGGPMDLAEEGRPSSAILLPWRKSPSDPLTGVKSLSYAAFTLGTEYARTRGADEGLWLTTKGFLCEGCSSNVFALRGRRLFTPSLRDGILAGVTRGYALRAAKELGLIVHEGKIRVERLARAEEAFLTSSLRGVRPLIRFEGRAVGRGEPGPRTRALAAIVARLRGLDRIGF